MDNTKMAGILPLSDRGRVELPCSRSTSQNVESEASEGPDRDTFGYTKADRRQASKGSRVMGLNARVASEAAESLVDDLCTNTLPNVRPTSLPKLKVAVGAVVADLLVAAGAGQWTRRGLTAASFTGQDVTRTMFEKVHAAFSSHGLVDVIPGYYERDGAFHSGWQTLFRPTQALIDRAETHGLTLSNLAEHFTISRPKAPASTDLLVLRTASTRTADGVKRAGSNMVIPPEDPEAAKIVADLEELNAWLGTVAIEGFAFPGLRRIFSGGDQPGFRWQWGGRFYSVPGGDDYMRWRGGKSARAAAIRLQGEDIEEVDLSASHLTVLYGLLGEPFDPSHDPYAIDGQSRDRVKRWITYALGVGSTAPRESNWYARVREAVLRRHPLLEGLDDLGVSTLDLQFHEAEVIAAAMRSLRHQGVASLPVFDSLVVARSRVELAKRALERAFAQYFQRLHPQEASITPRVKAGH